MRQYKNVYLVHLLITAFEFLSWSLSVMVVSSSMGAGPVHSKSKP